ncbi:hypothetical protein EDD11_009102 [Mortierella claussenii]|nr:hypothetical protein EDD11_009102 [Mortierella claussenii]
MAEDTISGSPMRQERKGVRASGELEKAGPFEQHAVGSATEAPLTVSNVFIPANTRDPGPVEDLTNDDLTELENLLEGADDGVEERTSRLNTSTDEPKIASLEAREEGNEEASITPVPAASKELNTISTPIAATNDDSSASNAQSVEDEKQDTPPLQTIPSKPLPTPETPVPIPAQIAIVDASPSKRVAFSPNKQESRLSNPNTALISKLKGILKPPPPLRILDGELGIGISTSGARSNQMMGRGNSTTDEESFVKTALVSLESEDLQWRSSAYLNLQAKFREGDDKPYLNEVRETMRTFVTYLLRDLDSSNPPSLVQAALKCTSYYFFNQSIVVMFTPKETELLLAQLLHLINTTTEKPTCNLAIWTLSSARVAPRLLLPFLTQMIQAFLDNLDSRFKSSSITSESLGGLFSLFVQFPNEILTNVQAWLNPVLMRLVSSIPGIRSRALELLTMAIPKLIEKEDPRRTQAVSKFMKERSSDFFVLLTKNFLDVNDEVYAITVWGAMVTLIGRPLQKSSSLNPMLKMAEKCFNSTTSRRTEIKMAAFQAWTFLTERHKRVRLACTNAWIALIYALGPKLPKHADQVLFPQLKLAIMDDSEHIRDLALRLLVALISNSGGQDLVEGRLSIVPGTITFADLGWANATWVRTVLLDRGLDCIYYTIGLQHKIQEAAREDWRKLGLTELPLLTQRCARTWEGIVRAIRDINLQEKGMKATPEADRAVSSLLYFVDKVSHCDAKVLIPGEWPECDAEKLNLLTHNPDMAGKIVRADIVHYLYACVVDIFSAKTLVSSRYRVQDKSYADLHNTVQPDSEPNSQASEVMASSQSEVPRELSPLEFILKSWLVTGESVVGTTLEDPFWQAVAFFVELFTKGVKVLHPLFKCLDYMEDIRVNSQNGSIIISPSSQSSLRIFQCKYWAIIAQRLGVTITRSNEISDDAASGDQNGYNEFFSFMVYPFSILRDPSEAKRKLLDMDHSQRIQQSQDGELIEKMFEFMETFEATSMPAWRALLRAFYNVSQHKRGNANTAMNTLAGYIKEAYDGRLPFIWIQSLSVAYTSAIVDVLVIADSRISSPSKSAGQMPDYSPIRRRNKQNLDDLLELCSFLFEEAYNNIDQTKCQIDSKDIPPLQESAFLLMEKIINKAPSSQIVAWFEKLQRSIIIWIDDTSMNIRDSLKAHRRPYRSRIDAFWNLCVLRKLLSCSTENGVGGPKSAFGSVLPGPVTTIRGAFQQQQQQQKLQPTSPFGSSSTALVNPFLVNSSIGSSGGSSSRGSGSADVFNSETLAILSPLLFAALNSHGKSIVNKTLEFWNQTFGQSKTNLEYPEDIVLIMQQLKLVATISLPGWSYEDSSQTEVPQFASLSQDMLSTPAELNVKSGSGLARLLKEKAEVARQLSPRRKNKRSGPALGIVLENNTKNMLDSPVSVSAEVSIDGGSNGSNSNSASTNNSRAVTPSPLSTPKGSRPQTPLLGPDSTVMFNSSHTASASPSQRAGKRKKGKIAIHALEIDHVNKSLASRTGELMSGNNTPEDSADEVEVSSPSKRLRGMLTKTVFLSRPLQQPLPAAPLWPLRAPMKPYHPVEDTSSSSPSPMECSGVTRSLTNGPPASSSVVIPNTEEINVDKEEHTSSMAEEAPARLDKESGDMIEAIDPTSMEVEPTDQILTANNVSNTEPHPAEAYIDKEAGAQSKIQLGTASVPNSVYFSAAGSGPQPANGEVAVAMMPEMTTAPISSEATKSNHPEALASWSLTAMMSIETGDEFSKTVQRLVDARNVVGQMNLRQLHELQSQLMTLNQAVCGAWGQIVQDEKDIHTAAGTSDNPSSK